MPSLEWEEWECKFLLSEKLPLELNSPLVWLSEQWTWSVFFLDSMQPNSAIFHYFYATEDVLSLPLLSFKVFYSSNSQITNSFSAHAWCFQELLLLDMTQWLITPLDSCSFGPQTSSKLSKTYSPQNIIKTNKLLHSRLTSISLASDSQSCYS